MIDITHVNLIQLWKLNNYYNKKIVEADTEIDMNDIKKLFPFNLKH